MTPSNTNVQSAYNLAKERYAALGVDTEQALTKLENVSISLHCWQGDDVGGFESPGGELGGGLAATGNYPGKARTADELRNDLDVAYSLLPGSHRLNLHAIYLEADTKVERNAIEPRHFTAWKDWAQENGHGIDFNPTCFSHPLAADGFTLSHRDPAIRQFWVEHCIASRKIGDWFGQELGTPAVTNIWTPDGYKDTPADRTTPRELLLESLDTILAEKLDHNLDAVEPKLFGIGSESYVVGSMEFYTAYALSREILLTLDSGHFHPTETIADKISSILLYLDEILLHVSRGVRWDSDHVVTFNDDLQAIAQEIVRADALGRVHIGLDYFDASINRVAAWTIGARNTLRAVLNALLEPLEMLRTLETEGDFSRRLALQEELKAMPSNAVWDYYCMQKGVPVGVAYMDVIKEYEKKVLSKRAQRSFFFPRLARKMKEERNRTMPTIQLYANLRNIAGVKELSIMGANLGQALNDLVRRVPALDGVILENGQVRPHFVITINGHNATDLGASVMEQDSIAIFPPIAGG